MPREKRTENDLRVDVRAADAMKTLDRLEQRLQSARDSFATELQAADVALQLDALEEALVPEDFAAVRVRVNALRRFATLPDMKEATA